MLVLIGHEKSHKEKQGKIAKCIARFWSVICAVIARVQSRKGVLVVKRSCYCPEWRGPNTGCKRSEKCSVASSSGKKITFQVRKHDVESTRKPVCNAWCVRNSPRTKRVLMKGLRTFIFSYKMAASLNKVSLELYFWWAMKPTVWTRCKSPHRDTYI